MAQRSIRNTLIASFGTVAAIAVLLGGAAFIAAQPAGDRLDASEAAFVASLAAVEGELTSAVVDLVSPADAPWPTSLDDAFQGFADAASGTDITEVTAEVNGLLQSGQAFRAAWPAAVTGDADAIGRAGTAYRGGITAIHDLERLIVGDRMAAGAAAAELAGVLQLVAIGGSVLAAGAGALLCCHCIITITGPLRRARGVVHQAAAGSLSLRIGDAAGRDELGGLCADIDRLLDASERAMQDTTEQSAAIARSATDLAAKVQELTQGAGPFTDDATPAAGSAESVSTSMTTMAASAREITAGLQAIAASATGLSTSFQTIDEQAGSASAAAGDAATLVADSAGTVAHLGQAAEEIQPVVDVIQDIAEQTNVLALNATIEAARTGETGTRFAAVAAELTQLARQTSDATGDIRHRIEAIQRSAGESVGAIGRISDVIATITSATGSIADAADEPHGVTQEITRTADASATTIERLSEELARSADASEAMGRTIAGANARGRESAESLQLIQSGAEDVAGMAASLREHAGRFRT